MWFGVLMCLAIEIGLVTPPVGFNVYVMKGIFPDVPLQDIFMGACIFLLGAVLVIALVFTFPALTNWLPSVLGK